MSSELPALQRLHLKSNKIGNEGIKALTEGFPNFQQLHLYSDDIPCEFAKILAETTQLRVFSNGRIGKEIGKAL
ncbi:hypothetical protein [Candidatus Cardinium hertigii]|uniref:Uncharacterized protein n=1 Tax=Candidatus Cardinium hertigii TaxID=247481 RepID=A0A2Z3L927_9BACT|nr:hypothetical protein [Candidatus Cardinium hertigii]AWN81877.1 hypothetical protein DK880_00561 [Candidatus Cardinium hertigii]